MFSVYAAFSGARRVVAYEPNLEAYACCVRNVKANSLSDRVEVFNKAIGSTHTTTVSIPARSSPYNSVVQPQISTKNSMEDQGGSPVEMVEVEATSLPKEFRSHNLGQVHLLKMDCEDFEYVIMPSLGPDDLSKIDHVRMECHGSHDQLVASLQVQPCEVMRSDGNDLWLRHRSS